MKVYEINPHIRFAKELNYHPTSCMLCAPDYHFYYTLSECTFEILNTCHNLTKNTVVIIPAETPYRIKCNKKLKIISINFDYTQNFREIIKEIPPVSIDDYKDCNTVERVFFDDASELNQPLIREDMGHHLKDVETILSEFSYKRRLFREVCSGYLKNLIVKISRESHTEESVNCGINEILDYIHRHYSEEITNEGLAEISGYHSYHLNRLMKKATGTTLHQYLINYRIESAKQYLRETDFTIMKISELCGYGNFSNFSHDFKVKTGFTPGSYRENFGKIV